MSNDDIDKDLINEDFDSEAEEHSFLEVSASEVEESLFHAEISWSPEQWPFEEGFDKRFSQALGVFQKFLLTGHKDFKGLGDKDIESLFVHISLCDDEKMRDLNRTHRNKDKTTDVLSFPLYEDIRSGEEMIFQELEFGDIIISVPVMAKQAKEFKVSVEGEFFHLLTHGLLHLCGYDHEISEEEEKLMEAHEQYLIKVIYESIY